MKNVKYINEYNNDIYHVSKNKILKYSTDLNNTTVVYQNTDTDCYIYDMSICDSNLYFCTGSELTVQYSLNLTTNSVEKLVNNVDGANINNSRIYYSSNSDKGLFEYDMNTHQVIKLVESNVSSPLYHNDRLFFSNFDNCAFYQLDLTNNNALKKIVDTENGVDYFNLVSNKLIYEEKVYLLCRS